MTVRMIDIKGVIPFSQRSTVLLLTNYCKHPELQGHGTIVMDSFGCTMRAHCNASELRRLAVQLISVADELEAVNTLPVICEEMVPA
jgi:hypothetical protein